MKNLLILIVLLSHWNLCSAQFSTVFQTVFYFEDAVGNMDTITVSGDTIVTDDIFNPAVFRGDSIKELNPEKQFEVITLPWYEMLFRDVFTPAEFWYGFHPVNYNYYKNIVIDFKPDHTGESVFFLFKCQHYPVTVRWDTTYYAQYPDVISGTQFLPDNTMYSNPDIFPPVDYQIDKFKCLRFDGRWTFHLGDDEDYNRPFEKVIGFFPGVQDTLFGVLLNYFPYFNCSEVSSVQNGAAGNLPVASYPNPAQGELTLQFPTERLPAPGIVHLYDVTRRLVRTQTVAARQEKVVFSIKDLPMGLYFYEVGLSGRTVARGKVIKQ